MGVTNLLTKHNNTSSTPQNNKMKAVFVLLSCLMASAMCAPKNDLTCSICVDFVEQICAALGAILPDLVATCNALVESQLPAIIDGLVNDNLNPQEVCNSIGACP